MVTCVPNFAVSLMSVALVPLHIGLLPLQTSLMGFSANMPVELDDMLELDITLELIIVLDIAMVPPAPPMPPMPVVVGMPPMPPSPTVLVTTVLSAAYVTVNCSPSLGVLQLK